MRELLDELTELEIARELLERLDELLLQMFGKEAQYASLQVSGGQSGQLLPCGQLKPILLEALLEDTEDLLEGIKELELDEMLDELLLHTAGFCAQ